MRRAVFYLFYDPQGRVDDFVLHTLGSLRHLAEHIFVVSNSPLDEENTARMRTVADQIWERENVGYDVWAYKEAMHVVGAKRMAEFDEILLMNCTFFGPVGGFDDLFHDMDAREEVDFWGITEHGDTDQHAFDKSVPMAGHIQSHWIGARHRLFTSPVWQDYWEQMPMIISYQESIVRHESRFTAWFVENGFNYATAFPADHYDSQHPIMDNVAQMLRDGCPIVKRRTFFHDPLYNESHAMDGRQVARLMAERGYPLEMMYANLARTATPRSLVTNLALLEVLPQDVSAATAASTGPAPRVVAVAHIYYPDMTDEILDRLDTLPHGYHLVVTTADEGRRAEIREVLERRQRPADVRLVASNRGRDISAFFIDCKDVIESDDYDLVVKVHSKRSPQDGAAIGELFKRHLFENLLGSPGYTANLIDLFVKHESLGMVFPPIYNIAYPTLGHAWFGNEDAAEELVDRLGITVPFDDSTPLAAYGSMYVARPAALRAMTAAGFTHDDFPDDDGYSDGALTHVLERLTSYVVLSSGHHIREVMTADMAALNYSYVEYRAIALSGQLPGYPRDQLRRIAMLKRFRRRVRKVGVYADDYDGHLDDKRGKSKARQRPRPLPPGSKRAVEPRGEGEDGADSGTASGKASGNPSSRPGRNRPAGSGGTSWRGSV